MSAEPRTGGTCKKSLRTSDGHALSHGSPSVSLASRAFTRLPLTPATPITGTVVTTGTKSVQRAAESQSQALLGPDPSFH